MAIPINYLAVIVAAIINMVLGMFWYGPLFGTYWKRVTGVAGMGSASGSAKNTMMRSLIIGFILAILMNLVLAHMILFSFAATNFPSIAVGISNAILIWLGFMLISTAHDYLWESKPLGLWAVHAGYYLVVLIINGALIGFWL